MTRKHVIYAALVAGLLVLNTGRLMLSSDRSATSSDSGERPSLVDTAALALGRVGEDDGDAKNIVRDLFAPVGPAVLEIQETPKPPPPAAAAQAQGPSQEELARQQAQEELDKFDLAGVLVKNREMAAMLVKEANYFTVKAGDWIGKEVLIQEVTFDDVVLFNQQWGLQRILSVDKFNLSDKD